MLLFEIFDLLVEPHQLSDRIDSAEGLPLTMGLSVLGALLGEVGRSACLWVAVLAVFLRLVVGRRCLGLVHTAS